MRSLKSTDDEILFDGEDRLPFRDLIAKHHGLIQATCSFYFSRNKLRGQEYSYYLSIILQAFIESLRGFSAERGTFNKYFKEVARKKILGYWSELTQNKHEPLNRACSLDHQNAGGQSVGEEILTSVHGQQVSVEDAAIRQMVMQEIWALFVQNATALERFVFERYIEGYTYREIIREYARLFNKPLNAKGVDNTIMRIKRKMQRLVASRGISL